MFGIIAYITTKMNERKQRRASAEYLRSVVETAPVTTDHKVSFLKYVKYHYLKSPKWRKKRDAVLHRDLYRCHVCNSSEHLHVHHMSGYEFVPNEPLECLVTLCADCHLAEHEKYGFPQTYEDYMNWKTPFPTSRTLLHNKKTYTRVQ